MFLPKNIARSQLSGDMAAMRAAEFHRLAVGTIPADPNIIQSTLPASKNKGYLHSYPPYSEPGRQDGSYNSPPFIAFHKYRAARKAMKAVSKSPTLRTSNSGAFFPNLTAQASVTDSPDISSNALA